VTGVLSVKSATGRSGTGKWFGRDVWKREVCCTWGLGSQGPAVLLLRLNLAKVCEEEKSPGRAFAFVENGECRKAAAAVDRAGMPRQGRRGDRLTELLTAAESIVFRFAG